MNAARGQYQESERNELGQMNWNVVLRKDPRRFVRHAVWSHQDTMLNDAKAAGFDFNTTIDDEGNTALHFAIAEAGAVPHVIQALVRLGADVAKTNDAGRTPMDEIEDMGDPELLKESVNRGMRERAEIAEQERREQSYGKRSALLTLRKALRKGAKGYDAEGNPKGGRRKTRRSRKAKKTARRVSRK